MFDDGMDDHLYYMVLLLGKLPGPWWTTWEAHKGSFEDEADPQARAIKISLASEQPTTEKIEMKGIISVLHPSGIQQPCSIQETLAPGLWYMNMEIGKEIHRDIPADEIEVFADLLGKVLKYNPSDRLTATAVQDHEWFKM